MWLIFAAGSAFFAGVTTVLAKCGIRNKDSDVATAVRTIVVFLFACLIVAISGAGSQLFLIDAKTIVFLVLSGAATGASWICYFRALKYGDVNKVVPVDKSSTVLTIILALIFFGEGISVLKTAAVVAIAVGIFLMIERRDVDRKKQKEEAKARWFLYAVGSAVFASLTTILGKIGIEDIDSNLGTAIRTLVVLAMAWGIVFASGKRSMVKEISRKELCFLCLSGAATGASWLCYYKALQDGPVSAVAPIDKLSVLVAVVFSYFLFREKLGKKGIAGLLLLTAGTAAMAVL